MWVSAHASGCSQSSALRGRGRQAGGRREPENPSHGPPGSLERLCPRLLGPREGGRQVSRVARASVASGLRSCPAAGRRPCWGLMVPLSVWGVSLSLRLRLALCVSSRSLELNLRDRIPNSAPAPADGGQADAELTSGGSEFHMRSASVLPAGPGNGWKIGWRLHARSAGMPSAESI